MQTEFLKPRLPDPETADEDYQVEVDQSGTFKESGSEFKGFAVTVNSLSDATAGIQEGMMTMPDVSTATHLIYAYRVRNGQSVNENLHSDDDHGMGLDLLRIFRDIDKPNVLCVISREHSSGVQYLGRRRFEIERRVGKEAFKNLE